MGLTAFPSVATLLEPPSWMVTATNQEIRVSARKGEATDDRTGLSPYDPYRPFETVQAALDASIEGDRISVEPGAYSISATLTNFDGRLIHLYPDVVLTGDTGSPMIYVPAAETLVITGYGEILNNGAGTTLYAEAGSFYYVQAKRVANIDPAGGPSVSSGASLAYLVVNVITAELYDALIYSGGECYVWSNKIRSNGISGNAVSVENNTTPGGRLYIESDEYSTLDGYTFVEDSTEACTVCIRGKSTRSDGSYVFSNCGTVCDWYVETSEIYGDDGIFDGTPGAGFHLHVSSDADSAATAIHHTIGTGANQAAAGDHIHGNITNVGAIGSTSQLPVVTTTSGALTTGVGFVTVWTVSALNQTININSGSAVDIVNQTFTMAAGDAYLVTVWGSIQNNSGSIVGYTATFSLGSLTGTASIAPGGIISGTDRRTIRLQFLATVESTSSADLWSQNLGHLGAALGSSNFLSEVTSYGMSNESGSNFTGSQAIKVQITASIGGGTQNFRLKYAQIERAQT